MYANNHTYKMEAWTIVSRDIARGYHRSGVHHKINNRKEYAVKMLPSVRNSIKIMECKHTWSILQAFLNQYDLNLNASMFGCFVNYSRDEMMAAVSITNKKIKYLSNPLAHLISLLRAIEKQSLFGKDLTMLNDM